MTELDAYKFACYSMETGMARVHWMLDNDPEFLAVLKAAAFDVRQRFLAHHRGAFPPPTGERWEHPSELEESIGGVKVNNVQDTWGGYL
jgi:hypothetical protein